MFPQIACMSRGKVTVVALVRLVSWVSFQMSLQMARLNRCIITLVAFVRFLPKVSFQMCPHLASVYWSKLTLIAFVHLLSWVTLKICCQIPCLRCIRRRSVHFGDKLLTAVPWDKILLWFILSLSLINSKRLIVSKWYVNLHLMEIGHWEMGF